MVRPTAAKDDDTNDPGDPPFLESENISPENRVTDLEAMFKNQKAEDDADDLDGADEPPRQSAQPEDDDDDYRFDDRDDNNMAAEALRRARRTEEAVSEIYTSLTDIKGMMQNGGDAAPQPSTDDFRFSKEDRELINDAMKTDPASAMEILHGNLLRQARQLAGDTAAANVARESARQNAERDVASMFPAMRRKNSKFRSAVERRTNEMRREYKSRGIDPDTMPELVKYAAMDVASTEPQLLGSTSRDVREDSRQRAADKMTRSSTNRSTRKSDEMPDLSEKDIQRGRRMGLNMSDPKVVKSLKVRRRFYEDNRR